MDNIYPDLSNTKFDIKYARLKALPSDITITLSGFIPRQGDTIPETEPGSGDTTGMRFAYPGEDDTGALGEDRVFDSLGSLIEIYTEVDVSELHIERSPSNFLVNIQQGPPNTVFNSQFQTTTDLIVLTMGRDDDTEKGVGIVMNSTEGGEKNMTILSDSFIKVKDGNNAVYHKTTDDLTGKQFLVLDTTVNDPDVDGDAGKLYRYTGSLSSGSGDTTERFGIEDNTGVQDRSVDMGNFSLSMEHGSYYLFEADNIANTGYGILYAQSSDKVGGAKAEIGAIESGVGESTIRATPTDVSFIRSDGGSVTNTFKIPDNSLPSGDSATLAISVKVNGTTYYADADGNIDIGTL